MMTAGALMAGIAATLPEPLWTTDVSPEAVKARQERVKRQNMKK